MRSNTESSRAVETVEDFKNVSMLVVMGVTGAGKSHFINRLAGKTVTEEGESVHSCTFPCKPIWIEIGGKSVIVIDTPGFGDGERCDDEILAQISCTLAVWYKLGASLRGIIYVHRIDGGRFTQDHVRTLETTKRICGDAQLERVMLVTSRWSKTDEITGSRIETGLRKTFWSDMLSRGSKMARFYGSKASATALVSQLIHRVPVVLELQREIVDKGKMLGQTAAGAFICDGLGGQQKAKMIGLDRFIGSEADVQISKTMRVREAIAKAWPYVPPVISLLLSILFNILGLPVAL